MEKTKYYSYKNNQLTKGCQLCVEGKKLVLFITGLCNKSCWYCPLSEEKYKKDVQFANERTINTDQDLIEEAKTMQACGVGITGGDPLKRLDLTLHYITLLKTKFGQNFHIHLYTSPESITKEILERLELLDEIRLHPDLEDKKYLYGGAYFLNNNILHFITERQKKQDKTFLYTGFESDRRSDCAFHL